MTRPRAADDFPTIRSLMMQLRRERMARPRAADDFVTIRARMEELLFFGGLRTRLDMDDRIGRVISANAGPDLVRAKTKLAPLVEIALLIR